MSDRDLGSLSAINIVLTNIIKCNCIRHFAKNLKSRFRNQILIENFWIAAYTHDENLFESTMSEVQSINLDFYNVCISVSYLRQDPLAFVELFFTSANYSNSNSDAILPISASGLIQDELYLQSIENQEEDQESLDFDQ